MISLSKLDERLREKILNKNNIPEAQEDEWEKLFFTEEKYDLEKIKTDENEKYTNISIDTKHFDEELKYEILSSIEGIEDKTNGILIHSDNFQALNIIKNKYSKSVKCIYIDPPYNTGNDDFAYFDNFSSSSWLTMMENRLTIAREFLAENGAIFVSIDDNEQARLKLLMDEIFGVGNFVGSAPRKTINYKTIKSDAELQDLHDYIHIYWNSKINSKFNRKIICQKTYSHEDERGKFYTVLLQDNGPDGTKTKRPNLFYPIYQDENGNFSLESKNENDKRFLPKKHKGNDRRWIWGHKKFLENHTDLFIKKDQVKIKHYYDENEDQNKYQKEKLWFDNIECLDSENFQNSKGTTHVKKITQKIGLLYPKPEKLIHRLISLLKENSLILDFFLGSGTTTSVSHKMGKKYIGIEAMNDTFFNIIIPRMKHVLFGEQVGMSKDLNWKGGGIFKYYSLENFENDTLAKCDYKFNNNEIDKKKSEKLLTFGYEIIDENKDRFSFEKIFPGVDMVENIANIYEWKIKKIISKDKVIFIMENGEKEISLNELIGHEFKKLFDYLYF